MTDVFILEALKTFIKREVADITLLQKPPTDGEEISDIIEYVHPNVYIGYMPPKNFIPEGYDIPVIIVAMENGTDDGQSASIDIRITFAVYSAGTYNNGQFTPDMHGYIDLLDLMEKTRQAIFQKVQIEKETAPNRPVSWGLYEEQMYPYWHGFLKFPVNKVILSLENNETEQFL